VGTYFVLQFNIGPLGDEKLNSPHKLVFNR